MENAPGHFYEEPDQKLIDRRFKEYKEQFIEPYFPANKESTVLDFACGYGLFVRTCHLLGYMKAEGIDVDEAYIRYGEEKLDIKNLRAAEFHTYLEAKPDQSYEVIVGFNIIEHLKKETVEETLAMICRKLKPGGVFIMEVPNADSPLGIHTRYSDLTHECAFTRDLLARIFMMTGFTKVIVKPKFINSNHFIRLAQKMLAKIIGVHPEFYYSGNIVAVGYRPS